MKIYRVSVEHGHVSDTVIHSRNKVLMLHVTKSELDTFICMKIRITTKLVGIKPTILGSNFALKNS